MAIYKFCPELYNVKVYGELLFWFLDLSISINFMLAFFNLLPLYPLDGYKIVESCCRFENGFLRFMKSYSFIIR